MQFLDTPLAFPCIIFDSYWRNRIPRMTHAVISFGVDRKKKPPLITFCRWQGGANVKNIAIKHSELSAIVYVIFFIK